MLYVIDGDLLKSDCQILIHQCNCQSNMGAGLAAKIAKKFPEAVTADQNFQIKDLKRSLQPKDRLGRYSYAWCEDKEQKTKKLVVNIYGQLYPGKPYNEKEQEKRYNALESALDSFLFFVSQENTKRTNPLKIGIPYLMGSDLAGGDWNRVSSIVEKVSKKHNTDIYVYKLKK